MKPKSLSIKGMYSYKKEIQTIDFEALSIYKLFGIFGDVGSGKSTILEAMSLALFGQEGAERLVGSKTKKNYQLMNLDVNELYIDFQFYSNGSLYRTQIKGKRKKNNIDDVTLESKTGFKWDELLQMWQPIEWDKTKAEEIIGLKAEYFKRAIIIPQGKFMEFIQLSPVDRTIMMRELFDLHRYEVSNGIKIVQQNNEKELNYMHGEYDSIHSITEEDLTAAESELTHLSLQIKNSNKEIQDIEFRLQQTIQAKNIQERYVSLSNEYVNLLKEKDLYEEKEKHILHLELAEEFRNNLVSLEYIEHEIAQKETEKKSLNELLADVQHKQKEVEILLITLHDEYFLSDKANNKVESLRKLSEYHKKQQKMIDVQSTLQSALTLKQSLLEMCTEIHENIEIVLQKDSAEKKEIHRLEYIYEAELWLSTYNHLLNNSDSLSTTLRSVEEKILAFKQELNQIVDPVTIYAKKKKVHSIQKYFELAKDHLNIELTLCKERKYILEKKKILHDYTVELKPHEACPLCGSTHHNPMSHEYNTEELHTLTKKEIDLQERLSFLHSLEIKSRSILDQLNTLYTEQSDIILKMNHIDKQSNEHLRLINDNVLHLLNSSVKEIEIFIQHEKKDLFRLKTHTLQLESTLKEMNEKLLEKRQKIQTLEYECIKIQEQQNLIEKDIQELKDIIDIDIINTYIDHSKDDIINELDALFLSIQNKINEKEYAEKELQSIFQKREFYFGQSQLLEKHVQSLISNTLTVSNELNDKFESQTVYNSISDIKNALQYDIDLSEEKSLVKVYYANLNTCFQAYTATKTEQEENPYDEIIHRTLCDTLEEKKQLLSAYQVKSGIHVSHLESLKEHYVKKLSLGKRIQTLKNTSELIKELQQLLKGEALVRYVAMWHMKALCIQANKRFQQLNAGALQLSVNDMAEFEIIDLLHSGRKRSIHTLSGGQSFQVALCLAIALSESVLGNNSDNFFFLDEGFGSLDKKALEDMLHNLRGLCNDGRTIGIISHVEELKQEVPKSITIKNIPGKGSVVYT
jgi:DNA repair protein SbcC/Rad50